MEKKNIDWSNIGFGYMRTDKRYVSNFKNGAWDEGTLTSDDQITNLSYGNTGISSLAAEFAILAAFRSGRNVTI